jgi:hypothetical protein
MGIQHVLFHVLDSTTVNAYTISPYCSPGGRGSKPRSYALMLPTLLSLPRKARRNARNAVRFQSRFRQVVNCTVSESGLDDRSSDRSSPTSLRLDGYLRDPIVDFNITTTIPCLLLLPMKQTPLQTILF